MFGCCFFTALSVLQVFLNFVVCYFLLYSSASLFLRRSLLPAAPRRRWRGQDPSADDHVSCRLQSVSDLCRHSRQAQKARLLSVNMLRPKFTGLHDWSFERKNKQNTRSPSPALSDLRPHERQNILEVVFSGYVLTWKNTGF